MAKYKKEKKPISLQSYDVSKCFDKEMMEDGIITCMNRGANPKAVRLWYQLNQVTEIQVNTSAGLTEAAPVGPVSGRAR